MNEASLKKIRVLRKEIRGILANKLTYTKTLLQLVEKREVSGCELRKAMTYIDECIQLVDTKFLEFLDSSE